MRTNNAPQIARAMACNDNGVASVARGAVAPRGILTAAVEVCGRVLLSYVAQGSMILVRAERRRFARAA